MTRRILIGAILHETNTFNIVPTTLADFAGRYLLFGTEAARDGLTGTATEIAGFLLSAEAYGWEPVVAVAAACGPSGPLAKADWNRLKAALLEAEGPFDGIALALHGAMVTADSIDPEGDLLSTLRERHGDRVPIVATLDMHANVSARMVAAADALFPYHTYPHVDHVERARDAADALMSLISAAASSPPGRLTRSVLIRPPMLDAADHGRTNPPGPMNALIERATEMQANPDVISVGITIGFPWADVPDVGPAALVTVRTGAATDPTALAMELVERLWESRHETQLEFMGIEQAIAAARAVPENSQPLVLADFADNPAAGAYGDSPNLLRAMIEAGLRNAAFATLADPETVRSAFRAGEGASLDVTLGGRHAPHITPPLQATAEVLRLHDGRFECAGPMLRGLRVDMGPTAVLRVGDIQVVVSTRALAVTDVNLFRAVGIEPCSLRTIALKSRNHHRAAFGPLASAILLVDAGGIATMRLAEIHYRNIRMPIWPLSSTISSLNRENTHVFDTCIPSQKRSRAIKRLAEGG